ncbi:MAG: ABC transporter ATP-binding protein [Stenotrophomonas sp.]|jgi:ATP-binding cassette subfamily B protein|uniref:ATP-binding cassette, subfamily B n=1 Tax=Oryzisolibacter propanilivorax TaxID=1527607 RepID=A0A1G9UQF6_9BURK|nr:ABC transporter ATP-binding protein [Oryzisolibacter propanilivorax]SDM62087.1 ATP-binding cassette, subfamily B [Oryzisolibacter propanilivorax]
MIRDLLFAGHRLSGQGDTRLRRGIALAVLEGVAGAAMYLPLILLLQEVAAGTVTPLRISTCALAMLACMLLRIMAGHIGMPMLFAGAYAMMGEARLRVADHLRHVPMGWFTRQRSGDLSARLTSDLELIEHLWSHFLGSFVSGLAMPLALMLFLAWVDWRLVLVVLAGLPLAWIALAWTQHVVARPGERLIAASAAAQSALLEYVQGIAVIRSFGRFGEAWRHLVAVLDEQHAALVAVEAKPTPWLVSYGFLLEAGYIGLVFAGVWWLADDTLTPLTLVAFLVVAVPVYRQLFEVGLATMMLRFSRRALRRIEALLAVPLLPEPDAGKARSPVDHDIVFDGVRFAYDGGDGAVLDGVSCTIPARGLTAVVGPSGAGKTTLVNLIARLWDVQEGSIRLGGVDLREIGTGELHRHVALVFQDVVLFSGTVLDNLRLGRPEACREEVTAAARRAQAHDFIEALPQGYATVLDEGGASLSGGERQRISIARALLKDAPILLLDEATASVDPSAEAEIQRAIAELARGRTVVVIAHRLKNVRHADHILVMEHGRLVEQGRHDDLLLQGGLYAHLWSRQQVAQGWRVGTM